VLKNLDKGRSAEDPNVNIWVEEAVRGDKEAFGKLYDLYNERVYRHIYYKVGNHAEAEDLSAQVWMNALRAIGRYKQMGRPFVVWLLSIANNQVIDYYRSQKDRTSIDDPGLWLSDGLDLEAEAIRDYNNGELRDAILQLREDHRKVIVLRFIDGLDYSDIAAIMQKKEGAVRVIQHRALLALRKVLQAKVRA
jgi:RNA polymerase sigma-70 factor (ECF subfamily)